MRGLIGAATLVALGGAAHAQTIECAGAVAAERDRLGIAAEAIGDVQQARSYFVPESHAAGGWQTFLYPRACRGAYVIETGRNCRIEQTYATGACRLPGR